MLDFPRSVDELVQRFWGETSRPSTPTWIPPVDLIETPQAYLVRLELPGIDPADVEVTLAGDLLTVRGEKRREEQAQDQTWTLNERSIGTFERVFKLPRPAAAQDIEAEARHGVLAIRVAKAEDQRPRKIEIRTA